MQALFSATVGPLPAILLCALAVTCAVWAWKMRSAFAVIPVMSRGGAPDRLSVDPWQKVQLVRQPLVWQPSQPGAAPTPSR